MARPRWHHPAEPRSARLQRRWDRFVAIWASLNLLWVAFDLSYVPLRRFWLQRNLQPLPGLPLVLPLQVLPDITPWVDPLKGIEPHRQSQAWQRQFEQLDRALVAESAAPAPEGLLARQRQLTADLLAADPFLASGQSATLATLQSLLRQRADRDGVREASDQLLSADWLARHPWSQERLFWRDQVLPLLASTYTRSIDTEGRLTDHAWRVDLLLFQWVFLLDILQRVVRLKRRLPGLSWRDALLRRWFDLPLLLPCWRWLRLLPVIERLQGAGLVNLEPLRAAISRAVVALLAVELFEVLALQLLDGLQGVVRSPRWPQRLRALRSHQSVQRRDDEQELVALLRIWSPLLLSQVAPRLAPELQGLLGYSLRQSLERSVVPPPLRPLAPLLQMENGLSRQLAGGMVENLLDLSRSTGQRLARRDDAQLELLRRCIDRFWEELALALENGPALQRSQDLICALIESFKGTYISQIKRSGIEALIQELDQLMAAAEAQPETRSEEPAEQDRPEAGAAGDLSPGAPATPRS